MVEDPDSSLLAFIGGLFAWLFVPLGFGNWQSVASSLAGFTAMYKEMGGKRYFALALIFQNLSAYAFALMVYQFGGLITGELSFTWMTGLAIAALCIIIYLLLRSAPKVSPSNRLREVTN